MDNLHIHQGRGNKASTTILAQYQWPGSRTPFAHQKVTADFMVANHRAFILNEAGTGKSSSCIWAADYLMNIGAIKRVLIICPLSVLRAGWQDELLRTVRHRRVGVAYGTKGERKKVFASDAEFVLINVDGIKSVSEELHEAIFDVIIVDEFTQFKNVNSQRWKCLHSLIAPNTRVWMLSGTPAPQGPCDAYGPIKLIAPQRVPKYFTAWQDMVMRKLNAFKSVPRVNAMELVYAAMQPAIRFEKKDCLDLPPLMYQTIDVELTPQQSRFYDQMRREMKIAMNGVTATALNAASRMAKLLQIAMGAVNTDFEAVAMQFDISNRLSVVLELIEGASGKILVAVPYLNALHRLHEELSKSYSCEAVYGDVSSDKRTEIFRRFQSTPEPRILILQPSAAAHGVTLTEADTIIWLGPTTRFEVFEQFNARIDRPGQARKMTVYLLQGCEAEKKLNAAIQNLRNGHVDLTEMFLQIVDR